MERKTYKVPWLMARSCLATSVSILIVWNAARWEHTSRRISLCKSTFLLIYEVVSTRIRGFCGNRTLAIVIQAMIIRAPTMKPSLQPSRTKSSDAAFSRQLPSLVPTLPVSAILASARASREDEDSVRKGGAILRLEGY